MFRLRVVDSDYPFPSLVALVYLTGAIVFWFVLAFLYPNFSFVLMGLYPQVFSYIQAQNGHPNRRCPDRHGHISTALLSTNPCRRHHFV